MPTSQPRLSTVVEQPLYKAVEALAKKNGVSLSQEVRALILHALELIEDSALEGVVKKRKKNSAKSIPLDQVKRQLRIK